MGLSVALTCDGCMLFWKSRMRRRYVGVIVGALGILQHGCRGHLFRTRRTGRQMFLLNPKFLVGRSVGLPGSEAYQAGGSGLFVGGHGNCSASSF